MVKIKFTHSLRNRIIRHLRAWHRRLGIFAAFFLIFLSVSGIALNHTTLFSLSHHTITNTLLLDHYGIKPPSDIRFFQQKKWFVTDQLVWQEDKLVFESDDDIVSVAAFKDHQLVATASQLVIFTKAGDLVEKLDSSIGLPTPINGISITEHQVLLNTPAGYYQSDSDFIDWQTVQTLIEPKWHVAERATPAELSRAKTQFQSQFLNWERVMLDAHSGRIFGDLGVLFMDIVAIMLILLSVSCIYIWLRYARSKR